MIIIARKSRRTHFISIIILALSIISFSCTAHGPNKPTVSKGTEWLYFKGTDKPPKLWHSRDFDDSSWQSGTSGFGYGNTTNNTVLDDMKGQYKNVYVRREFNVLNSNNITRIILAIVCDGPFIAYLNDIEAIRSNRRQKGDPLNLIGFAHELDNGKNVIAIQCSNDDIKSNEFSFIPSFEIQEDDGPGIVRSHSH